MSKKDTLRLLSGILNDFTANRIKHSFPETIDILSKKYDLFERIKDSPAGENAITWYELLMITDNNTKHLINK